MGLDAGRTIGKVKVPLQYSVNVFLCEGWIIAQDPLNSDSSSQVVDHGFKGNASSVEAEAGLTTQYLRVDIHDVLTSIGDSRQHGQYIMKRPRGRPL